MRLRAELANEEIFTTRAEVPIASRQPSSVSCEQLYHGIDARFHVRRGLILKMGATIAGEMVERLAGCHPLRLLVEAFEVLFETT